MTIVSTASLSARLPTAQATPSATRPIQRREAEAPWPPVTAPGTLPLPAPRNVRGEHPALALYRDVQRLPGDGTDTWIGRIDARV